MEREQHNEQSIELLCKLLHTVGYQLDSKPGKYKGQLEELFLRLHDLSTDKKLPPRARFAVQEVLELRRNGWQERRVEEGPKLVSEIRMMAAQEERQQLLGGRSQRHRNDKGAPFGRDARESQDARDTRPTGKDDARPDTRSLLRPTKIMAKDSAKKGAIADIISSSREPASQETPSASSPSIDSTEKSEKLICEESRRWSMSS